MKFIGRSFYVRVYENKFKYTCSNGHTKKVSVRVTNSSVAHSVVAMMFKLCSDIALNDSKRLVILSMKWWQCLLSRLEILIALWATLLTDQLHSVKKKASWKFWHATQFLRGNAKYRFYTFLNVIQQHRISDITKKVSLFSQSPEKIFRNTASTVLGLGAGGELNLIFMLPIGNIYTRNLT